MVFLNFPPLWSLGNATMRASDLSSQHLYLPNLVYCMSSKNVAESLPQPNGQFRVFRRTKKEHAENQRFLT